MWDQALKDYLSICINSGKYVSIHVMYLYRVCQKSDCFLKGYNFYEVYWKWKSFCKYQEKFPKKIILKFHSLLENVFDVIWYFS